MIKKITTGLLFVILSFELFGQNAEADKKIREIESYKKYDIFRIDNPVELESLNDSTIDLKAMVQYSRKTKSYENFALGKVEEYSENKSGRTKRTYYFDEKSRIFTIIDNITLNDQPSKRLTYYYDNGHLIKVIDEKENDITHTVNEQKLHDRIRQLFLPGALAK